MPYRAQTWSREKSGKIVVPLDTLRAMDTGILVSFGGAVTSATLYSAQSGMEVYLRNLLVMPFSGAGGIIRLLDGTTPVTTPLVVQYGSGQGNGPGLATGSIAGGIQIPVTPGRFLSSINVEVISGGFWQAMGVSGVFAGGIYAEVLIDPKTDGE